LDSRQYRLHAALSNGVQPDVLRQYEGTLAFLHSDKIAAIDQETPEGEELRKQLIYQDFLNRGFTQVKA